MVMTEFSAPLQYMEFDKPQPKGGEALIRVSACGICGSDVHVWKGQDSRSRLPMILGHEGVGIVESLGGAQKIDIMGRPVKEGDLVVWNRGVSCKACYFCLVKRKCYLCSSRWTYGFSKSIHDYPYLNGAYASHILLTPETDIILVSPAEGLSDDIDPVLLASACCAGTSVACAFEQADVRPGDNVVIQGPGPLGIYSVIFARESGARNIVVVGGTPQRLAMCKEAGATAIIDRNATTEEERVAMVRALCDGRGAGHVFEMTGAAEAIPEGLRYAAVDGSYVSAGIAVDVGDVPVNWFRDVVRKNIKIQGVWVGDAKNTWQALEVYQKHKHILGQMITHRIPLTDATAALQMMESKEAIKAVLVP